MPAVYERLAQVSVPSGHPPCVRQFVDFRPQGEHATSGCWGVTCSCNTEPCRHCSHCQCDNHCACTDDSGCSFCGTYEG